MLTNKAERELQNLEAIAAFYHSITITTETFRELAAEARKAQYGMSQFGTAAHVLMVEQPDGSMKIVGA